MASTTNFIETSVAAPLVREGYPWLYSPKFEASDGSIPFPSPRTYSGIVRASSGGATLETATVTRASDTTLTIALTSAQITTIIAGLTFANQGLMLVSKCLVEIIRTDPTPDEHTGIYYELDVVS